MKLRASAPMRSVIDVGPGDYVKVEGVWRKIVSNTARNVARLPRNWKITTCCGDEYDMWKIDRYAKQDDFE